MLINLLRPLDPSRWPSPASVESFATRNQKFSDLVVKCLIKLTKVSAVRNSKSYRWYKFKNKNFTVLHPNFEINKIGLIVYYSNLFLPILLCFHLNVIAGLMNSS